MTRFSQSIGTLAALLIISLGSSANAQSLFYGFDTVTKQLITINPTTGAGTVVGGSPFDVVLAMAYDTSTGTLYGIEDIIGSSAEHRLVSINPATGAGTVIGDLGFFTGSGLAYDSLSDTLFATDAQPGFERLWSVDRATGAATPVGRLLPLPITIDGLAYDSSTDTLFGNAARSPGQLVTINGLTGAVTMVATLVWDGRSLTYDVCRGALFGVTTFTDELIKIDKVSGSLTVVGPVGFDGVTALAAEPAKCSLLLDFDTPIDRDFKVVNVHVPFWKRFPGQTEDIVQKLVIDSGSEPVPTFMQAQKDAILLGVQQVLDDSGIDIQIVDALPSGQPVPAVRFGNPLPQWVKEINQNDEPVFTSFKGYAYDVAPINELAGTDRYNRRADGKVAVFISPLSAEPNLIDLFVETIIHEAAHGWGVRHVNPVPGGGTEVMDYSDSASPQFTDSVTNIVEPPQDGQTAEQWTHNPAYHIRRYAVKENPSQIGLSGGTWDLQGYRKFELNHMVQLASVSITDLHISLVESPNALSIGDEPGAVSILLTPSVGTGESFEFSLPQGQNYELSGSSGDGTTVDIVFATGPQGAPNTDLSADAVGSQDGTVYQIDLSGAATIIGSFSVDIVDLGTGDADNDSIIDQNDNCTLRDNPAQTDTDGDGHGNACDADFNNDGVVNGLDVDTFVTQFGTIGPDADLYEDGVVNGLDVGPFVLMFGMAPGPSGILP